MKVVDICPSTREIIIYHRSPIYAFGLKMLLMEAFYKESHISIRKAIDFTNEGMPSPTQDETAIILWEVLPSISENLLRRQIARLRNLHPVAKILLYSIDYSSKILYPSANKGVYGYFLLSEKSEEIVAVIDAVLTGKHTFSNQVLKNYLVYSKHA
ncbi:MAG: hypothetical protein RL115_2361 [Bacteroidota bacterium]|jgi:DNA-binding NarL/FixJ family response regulator